MQISILSAAVAFMNLKAYASPVKSSAGVAAKLDYSKMEIVNFEDLPWANKTDSLAKRTPGGVEICTDINWGGQCGYQVQPLSDPNMISQVWQCIVLTSPWLYTISSFGPDQGAYAQLHGDTCCGCTCEAPSGCTAAVTYPGFADLRDIGWNDAIGSWYMFPN
ncbi:hypothetical protein F5884DRAFT_905190 [Xylogone sp. PMI_703]|nr:hypothetical protein F5884DRAFT_905190 [Xylogone sp. PMI_703]